MKRGYSAQSSAQTAGTDKGTEYIRGDLCIMLLHSKVYFPSALTHKGFKSLNLTHKNS